MSQAVIFCHFLSELLIWSIKILIPVTLVKYQANFNIFHYHFSQWVCCFWVRFCLDIYVLLYLLPLLIFELLPFLFVYTLLLFSPLKVENCFLNIWNCLQLLLELSKLCLPFLRWNFFAFLREGIIMEFYLKSAKGFSAMQMNVTSVKPSSSNTETNFVVSQNQVKKILKKKTDSQLL